MVVGWFATGALLCGLGVVLGAFGAHGLRDRLATDMLTVFETGVRYHLIHGIGLIVVAWATSRWPNQWVESAGWLFVVGIVIFSGSLYVLAISGMRWLGAVTPVGGLCLILGWVVLAIGSYRGAP